MKLINILKSNRKDKKYVATFLNEHEKTIKTHFGQAGASDYTINKDKDRRKRYLDRHQREDWSNPISAGTLSRYILWNKPTLHESIINFKKLFKL
jgi:hypothetical protein